MSYLILGAMEQKKDEKICIYILVTSFVRPSQPLYAMLETSTTFVLYE